MSQNIGKISQVIGAVIDVEFEPGKLPNGKVIPSLSNAAAIFPRYNPKAKRVLTLDDQIAFALTVAPKLTIQGGTTEILRGIIARGLGLR